jgi:hypothetical protein
VADETRACILLLFWQAWHLRNNIVHGNGACTVTGSAKFLLHLGNSMDLAMQREKGGDEGKGKRPVDGVRLQKDSRLGGSIQQRWKLPPWGWVKLNSDAAFCHETCEAGTGIIVRDGEGRVLLAAWRMLRGCGSPEQAEAEACLEGL